MSTDQFLLGIGLTLTLAVASQVLAFRLRIPAIIVLLPVGFAAGALTELVDPDLLFGPAFSPLVSLAVALILYEAGLSLDLRRLDGATRRVVLRLLVVGVPLTWGLAALASQWLLALSTQAAVMLGAILVVSGPTVVGPLLNAVRPVGRLQRVLSWEGVLIDPVGAILGALVLHAIVAHDPESLAGSAGRFVGSIGTGVVGGLVGAAVLWLVLVKLRPGEVLGAAAQVAVVLMASAVCDVVREDAGLVSSIVIGLVVANRREFALPVRRPFLETLVQLVLGVLFISISASVTPASVSALVLPTLGLVAVLVLVGRPLLSALATAGSPLSLRERTFVAWLAPRGIVAAATASTFGASLAEADVPGATRILPATFLVVVLTVTVYGLTAAPVGRWLGVTRSAESRPLLVGDDAWVLDLGNALRRCGLSVVLWSGDPAQRDRIEAEGLELAPGGLLATATGQGAELEGISTVLLLGGDDDFNALASVLLEGSVDGDVLRLPPEPGRGAVAPYVGGRRLFQAGLTGAALDRLHREGARIEVAPGAAAEAGGELLFVVHPGGLLEPTVDGDSPARGPGDLVVLLSAPGGSVVPGAEAGRRTQGTE